MKRKLLKQMRAEWRANIWMAVELLIVSVVLFVLADRIYVAVATQREPLGFNSEHCYLLGFNQVTEAAPDFKPYADDEACMADKRKLADRLRARPEIEAVAYGVNAYPYNGSNSMTQVDIDTISMASYPLTQRRVEPDFMRVFRIEGINGESPEEMAEALKRDRVMVSDNALYSLKGIESLRPMIGSQLVIEGDTLRLNSVYKPMRYSDYVSRYGQMSSSVFQLLRPDMLDDWASELVVRVRDNMDTDFESKLMDDADGPLRVGNWYIGSVRSFDGIRDAFNRNDETGMRNTVVCSVFLLVNIFLGILGTFWFRTQQRSREIALRMVAGASRMDIFRRILGEGQMLLACVTPFAAAIDYALTQYELTKWYDGFFGFDRFIVCVAIAWGLMSLMVMAGNYFPARRAMSISAATVLKSE